MKLNFKDVVVPAAILCLICIIVSVLLGVTNQLTADKIVEVQAEKAAESRMTVLPDADSFEEIEITDEYSSYRALKDGEPVGYVFTTEDSGYGGTLSVMTGISAEGQITGVAILSHGETPGLGANATKTSFTDQYKQAAGEIEVIKNQAAGEGQIEAITGATITSRAVTRAVNKAVDLYDTVKEAN